MQAPPPATPPSPQPPGTAGSEAHQRLARLEAYLRSDPNNALLLADVFAQAVLCKEWDRAAFYLRHGQSLQPGGLAWLLRESDFWIAQARYAQARDVLAKLQSMPELPQAAADAALHNLAWIEVQQGRRREALALLAPRMDALAARPQEARQVAPALCKLWLRTLHHEGRLDEAVAWARAVAAAGCLAPDAAGVAALAALDRGDLAEARAWSDAALQAPAQDGALEALVTRASLALAAQDAQAAAHWADAALQRHPQDGRALSTRAFAALLAHDLAGARTLFEHAVQAMGQHIGTWHGLAWTQLLAQDLEAAQRSFETALQLDRNVAESHGGMAVVLAQRQQPAAAREHIERAARLDPGNVSGQYAQALLDGRVRSPDDLRRLASRLLGARGVPPVRP